ncbi:ribonuclease H-like YkuK family protein [uncultured Paenibacillus sp.]|uniref:ribonuclease H-like YkuK family protein n=1 Tax=uncultured Paenibacillus sp. TaxID=227322 RepID=UPI0028D8A3CC|nr:ribonuclease H-like YkuK family protein [uncultured Paenibacillus sp.]
MKRNVRAQIQDALVFQNVTETGLTLDDVQQRIMNFMTQDPQAAYHFVVGTDSQVFRGYTKFVTGIIIRRLGKGAWACYRQVIVPRELRSLREKLAIETSLSQEIAGRFMETTIARMEDLLTPHVYKGASLELFIDIDAGTHPVINKTSLYVKEMIERVEAMGMYAARVKPDSYAASAYANRFTKQSV